MQGSDGFPVCEVGNDLNLEARRAIELHAIILGPGASNRPNSLWQLRVEFMAQTDLRVAVSKDEDNIRRRQAV
jgi:hypothetical protein